MLRVRDETSRVIDRARASKTSRMVAASNRLPPSTKSSVPSGLSSVGDTIPPDSFHVVSILSGPPAPSESLRELGTSYFLANYVLAGSGPSSGFLSYTKNVLADGVGDHELVQVAIRAVGLAGIASTTGTDSILYQARASYADAIRRINAALMDPRQARKDSTIFAVMALSLFETITCSDSNSMEAWRNHINGAANLLMHRGATQLRSPQGLRIFGETISHIITLCSRYNHPVPSPLRRLRVEIERQLPRKSPSWIVATAHVDLLDLQQAIKPEQDTACLPDEWETILAQAVALDQRLDTLIADLPTPWHFKIVNDPTANPRVVYHGTYHIYYSTWIAKIWDALRACRIFVNQAIYCLLLREAGMWAPHLVSPDGGVYAPLLQQVSDTTAEMRDGILASVPQMTGFVQHDVATGASYLDCSSAGMPRRVPASGPYFLLWFLFLAGSLLMNPPETRDWVVDRLREIRSATGIQKAGYLADLLEKYHGFRSVALPASVFLIPRI
ncbi:hypothetical protein BO70DRAFT_361393 [Aspergillus heteromorphus CBS 117.55]|uniref:Zn(II)2Cys6 transcription factor n=1 Tax=Aspergillus heteromorphus CBS 117.55 TaxID=1448321 RepID=A0A317WIX1_9EURO|nr:uncharacterized protein BO70DRAFT_361393 [Aspergillus heteromorphus CBS 117.55]PWY85008.1 hypothetical protein BO70DRAFT_361393 [Aspergillus heteromorphus CBS 117.55]